MPSSASESVARHRLVTDGAATGNGRVKTDVPR